MVPVWTELLIAAVAVAAGWDALRSRGRLRRVRERLEARERESHLLAESPDPDTILQRAHDAVVKLVPVSRFDLYTIDDSGRVENVWSLAGDETHPFPRRDDASPYRGQTIDAPRVREMTATETGLSLAPRDLLAGTPATRRLRLPLYAGNRLVAHLDLVSSTEIDDRVKAEVRALLAPLTTALHASRNWRIAVTDELSGLTSRRYFETRLTEEWSRRERYGTPLTVAIFDLDRFKGINDSLGHAAGDRVLRRFGELVRREIRSSDVACRYGGEEFAVLFAESSAAAASAVAERVRRSLRRQEFEWEGRDFRVTVSVGVAEAEGATDRSQLLFRADKALYRAKEKGRNRVVVWGSESRAGGARA